MQNIIIDILEGLKLTAFIGHIDVKTIKGIYIDKSVTSLLYSDHYLTEVFVSNSSVIGISKGVLGSIMGIPVVSNTLMIDDFERANLIFIYEDDPEIPEELMDALRSFIAPKFF